MRPFAKLRLWFLGLILGGLCAAAPADPVRVGTLVIDYDAGWQRASDEEEAQADSVILRRTVADGQITLTVPRHQPRLRVPQERFYQQLETVWRASAGDALHLDWLKAGDRRWRLARRPSVEDPDRVVFHLVSVADDHAQHLLVSAPAAAVELPPAVHALLNFPPLTAPTPAAANVAPVPTVSRNTQGSPTAAPTWQLDRTLHVLPDAAAFDALLQQERQRLHPDGGITGLGIEGRGHGFRAFLSGFVQTTGSGNTGLGRAVRRQHIDRSWEVVWEPPAVELPSGSTLLLRPSRLPQGVGLRVSLRHYCGQPEDMARLTQFLQQSVSGDAEEAMRRTCGAIQAGWTQGEIIGSQTTPRPLVFGVETSPQTGPQRHLLVLSVQPFVVGGDSGAALLGAAAVHYLYRPGSGR